MTASSTVHQSPPLIAHDAGARAGGRAPGPAGRPATCRGRCGTKRGGVGAVRRRRRTPASTSAPTSNARGPMHAPEPGLHARPARSAAASHTRSDASPRARPPPGRASRRARRRRRAPSRRGEQHRQAVGDLHGAGDAGLGGDARVGLVHRRAGARIGRAEAHDARAVHLVQEHRRGADRLARTRAGCAATAAGVVADRGAQVHAVERRRGSRRPRASSSARRRRGDGQSGAQPVGVRASRRVRGRPRAASSRTRSSACSRRTRASPSARGRAGSPCAAR